ncbi:MAG: hypothetical protein ACK5E6_05270 [Cyanobacteriota bacterium]|jgi:bacteriocin-like protein
MANHPTDNSAGIDALSTSELAQISGGLVTLKRPLGACPACTSGLNKFIRTNPVLNPVLKVSFGRQPGLPGRL